MIHSLTRRSNDTGEDSTSFATLFPYSVGLNGVDQGINFLTIYILLYLFFAAVIFTVALRLGKWFVCFNRHLAIMGNPTNQSFWSYNGTLWYPWLKMHLLYAPLWNVRRSREWQVSKAVNMGTLPGRGHFVLLAIYTIANIAWTVYLPYGEPAKVVGAALRGRSGIVAVFNLFPTIIFALRNNPLIPLLQVPYDTFNLFHRWCARIFIIEALVHMGAWMGDTWTAGGFQAVSKGLSQGPHAASFSWGMAAALTAFVILIQAWSPLRHGFYEVFLTLHKFLVLVTLIGVERHLTIDHLKQRTWLRLILALWVYEYAARFYRIVRYNVNRNQWSSRITIEALPGDACRVTFHLANNWKPRPGTHIHAYFPALNKWTPWTSHPFSVAWADVKELPRKIPVELPVSEKDVPKINLDNLPETATTVSLIIRARSGTTRRLYELASAAPNKVLHTWGFCEGFYGGQDNLSSYGNVLLFAGGVGITHHIMFTKQLLERYDKTVAARRITLIWSAPTAECLDWIRPWMNEILAMPGRRESVRILLQISRPRLRREFQSISGSVMMKPGRVNPQKVIDDEIAERTGAIGISVCGPGTFADQVRDAARRRVQHCVLDFFEEAFTF
jgi:predicted ferric reductase